MKRTLAILATLSVMAMAAKCYAVGTLMLENYTANKPVYELVSGTKATGMIYGQLLAGVAGAPLVPVWTSTTPYNFSDDPAFFDYGVALLKDGLTDVSPGTYNFQMVLWKGATRPQDAALIGYSQVWSQQTGNYTPTDPPTPAGGPAANLPNSIVLVPEPSTIALGLLGLAALLIRRRK